VAVEWIWLIFIFALGACIGSFLNVVIYRLPREKSLVSPPSACPTCEKPIPFYDNIPLFSWLILRGKCRKCRAPISIRYFIVELVTAVLFGGLYLWFFWFQLRNTEIAGLSPMQRFFDGAGWLFYLVIITMTAAFLAASAIDLELWIIPIEICWSVAVIGIAGAATAPFFITPAALVEGALFPSAAGSPRWAGVVTGATAGLIISLILQKIGIIKPSYEMEQDEEGDCDQTEHNFNDRMEILKEVIFLLPVIVGGIIGFRLVQTQLISAKWDTVYNVPVIAGIIGALGGYLAGCAVVWITRIFGTLAFGKEAMGLGDVHLMGAAGAVIGAKWVVLAFFVAPFFGIAWALYQAIFKKMHQIPYGPFLSLAVFAVIICQDWSKWVRSNFYGF
jgi:leader peptidase (prepilin peptidase)/N-methyltransferase